MEEAVVFIKEMEIIWAPMGRQWNIHIQTVGVITGMTLDDP